MSFRTSRSLFLLLVTVTAMLSVVSCNSSTGEPGLVVDSSTGATTNTTGIGGSGCTDFSCDLAVGDITGFGSVIINGAVYDISKAQFTANGMPATQRDFEVGMIVTAAADFDSQPFMAGSITYAPIVLGPVTTTELTAGSFEILGQTVVVDSNTVLLDVSLDSNSPDVIATGAVIEVSGIRNVDNQIVASFIRRADSATSYQLQGLIETATNPAQQLLISGLSVDVSGLDQDDIDANANQGDVVSLFLTPDIEVVTAVPNSTIAVIPTINELLARFNGNKIRVEGFISNYTPTVIFDTNLNFTFNFDDLQVFFTADTPFRFADGSTATSDDLSANSRIELVATTTGIGVVTAEEIIIIE